MPTGNLVVRIFDGSRNLIADASNLFVRLIDGSFRDVRRDYFDRAVIRFDGLPVYDNFQDDYTVLVSTPGYAGAGFRPVRIAAGVTRIVDLMLLPRNVRFNFPTWSALQAALPRLTAMMSHGVTETDAKQRYEELGLQRPASLAGLLNIGTALAAIQLPTGTPLDYMKALIWDETLAQDRFFAWGDAALVDQVRQACADGEFAPEIGPGLFHPGATSSWKQVQFGEANVQLTFHENDTKEIDGVACVKVEPDIDYYRDLGAHALLEVMPSSITGELTDPVTVYALRWIAGRHAGVPEFDPSYTIVPA